MYEFTITDKQKRTAHVEEFLTLEEAERMQQLICTTFTHFEVSRIRSHKPLMAERDEEALYAEQMELF